VVPAPISNDYDGISSVYRLQSEVDEVLGNKESVSAEDLTNLQYTEQVCLLGLLCAVCYSKLLETHCRVSNYRLVTC